MLEGNVLITGGAGFLGRAILRRAVRDNWPCRFTVLSRDEEKQVKLQRQFPDVRCLLGDVRDRDRLEAAFAGHNIVIHAAAMKYVPEAEHNVAECIAVNVEGTRNVALAAIHAGVETVVGISTDKAVLPTNTYGMTKALMERLFMELHGRGETKFALVRYGNVVGSTGSVIPLFEEQARAGRVTVTDDKMTRFWLSVDAAVDLIVTAGQPASGTILVPRCAAMRVVELARLIAADAKVEIVGARPGEKLHERLVDYRESAQAMQIGENYCLSSPTSPPTSEVEPWTYSSQYPARWIEPAEMTAMIEDARGV